MKELLTAYASTQGQLVNFKLLSSAQNNLAEKPTEKPSEKPPEKPAETPAGKRV